MLLTEELRRKLPALHSNEEKKPEDVQVIVKFFLPNVQWTWYATEGELDIMALVCNNDNGKKFEEREGISDEERKALRSLWEEGDKTRQNNRRLYSNLFTRPSESKKQLCQESRPSNGRNVGKTSFETGNSSSQKRKKDRRQTKELTSNVKGKTSNTSYKTEERERKLQWLPQTPEKKSRTIYKINDFTFYGYVRGIESELGYFRLSELEYITDGRGLGVERDQHFGKHTLAEVMAEAL